MGKMKNVPYFLRKPCSELVLHSPLVKKELFRIKGNFWGPGILRIFMCSHGLRIRLLWILQGSTETCRISIHRCRAGYLEETNHTIMLMDMLMYHPDDILVKVDRTAMAVSLETRVPMLDKDVVEFAWSLPLEYKRQDGTGKLVLQDVLYKYVPKELMDRPKKGFSIPIAKWLMEPISAGMGGSLIDRRTLETQGILNPDTVWKIWKDFVENGVWRIQIWYILMFQAWMADRSAVC